MKKIIIAILCFGVTVAAFCQQASDFKDVFSRGKKNRTALSLDSVKNSYDFATLLFTERGDSAMILMCHMEKDSDSIQKRLTYTIDIRSDGSTSGRFVRLVYDRNEVPVGVPFSTAIDPPDLKKIFRHVMEVFFLKG